MPLITTILKVFWLPISLLLYLKWPVPGIPGLLTACLCVIIFAEAMMLIGINALIKSPISAGVARILAMRRPRTSFQLACYTLYVGGTAYLTLLTHRWYLVGAFAISVALHALIEWKISNFSTEYLKNRAAP